MISKIRTLVVTIRNLSRFERSFSSKVDSVLVNKLMTVFPFISYIVGHLLLDVMVEFSFVLMDNLLCLSRIWSFGIFISIFIWQLNKKVKQPLFDILRKTINNLSTKTMSKLFSELNFAVVLNILVLEIISSVEAAIRNTGTLEMDEFCWKIRTEMYKTQSQKEVIKYLKENQFIKILPSAKGTCIVLISKSGRKNASKTKISQRVRRFHHNNRKSSI